MKKFFLTICVSSLVLSTYALDKIQLTVDKAQELALERNEKVRISQYELDVTNYNLKKAYSKLFPDLKLELKDQKSYQKPSLMSVITGTSPGTEKVYDNYSRGGSISLVQPIYTFGRISGGIDAAKIQKNLAQTNKYVSDASIKATIKSLYYNALFYKSYHSIAKESYDNALENQRALKKRVAYGRISQGDNLKMKADISSRKPALIETQRQYDHAISQIKNFLDLPDTTEVSLIDDVQKYINYEKPQEQSQFRLKDLAYVSLLEDQLALYETQVEVTKSDFYPTLSLFVNYGKMDYFESYNSEKFITQDTFAIGIALTMDYSLGGEKKHNYSLSKIQAKIKKLELEQGKRDVDRTLKSLNKQLEQLLEKKESLSEAVRVARSSYKVSLNLFKNGSITQTQLNDRELLLTNNKVAYARNVLEMMLLDNEIESLLTKTK